jgi:hypothetical protein
MRNELNVELLASTMIGLMRKLIEVNCRNEINKVMIVGLLAKAADGDVEKIAAAMESQTQKMVEDTLLRLGDIDPSSADLLGVAEYLKKL